MSLCVLQCTRPTAVGRVCWRHHDRLADLLDPTQHGTPYNPDRPDDFEVLPSIPVLYAELDPMPASTGIASGGSGVFRSSPPADLHVISMRDPRSAATGPGRDDDGLDGPWSTAETLRLLAERLDLRDLHARPVPLPGPPTVSPKRRPFASRYPHTPLVWQWHPPLAPGQQRAGATTYRVPAPPPWRPVDELCRWLHARLHQLVAVDWLDELWQDLRTIHSQLRAATGDYLPKPVGTCRQVVDDDGQENPDGRWRCAWPLYLPAQRVPRDPDRPAPDVRELPGLRCSSCGHRYNGAELIALGRRTREDIPA